MKGLLASHAVCRSGASLLAVAVAACFGSHSAQAQSDPVQGPPRSEATSEEGTIVVTARRREESLISVPVAVSVVNEAELDRRAIARLDNLAQSVPQLILAPAGGGAQGGIIVIRGIGVGEANPFADQAVSLNIDGVQIGQANVRRMAEIDMAQVEVLKGPQALFFGKNSPAGIIAIRTADPTPRFAAGLKVGYEFVGSEVRGEGFVSSPLSDSLGIRVAAFGSTLRGYFKNAAAPSATYGPARDHGPYEREYGGRITLKYESGSDFDARLKLTYGNLRTGGPQADAQTVQCPLGFAQTAPLNEDCKANDTIFYTNGGTAFSTALNPDLSDRPYLKMRQMLTSLEMNYHLSPSLTLSSITGYYHLNQNLSQTFTANQADRPGTITNSYWDYRIRNFSQELRLQSEFDGVFNFMLGGYYQHAKLYVLSDSVGIASAPRYLTVTTPATQKGDALSGFAQASFRISDTLELAGGGRYSYERKRIAFTTRTGAPLTTAVPERSWDNFSPEATLTWRPTQMFTLYGAYKTGFLSGGFSGSNGNIAGDRSYDQQTVKGFEIGAKGLALDGRLRGSLVLYSYDTKGLQINANVLTPGNPVPVQVVLNAGKSRTRGVEAEANYSDPSGFKMHASVAYNDGKYLRFTGPCYGGQTVAQGCNQVPNATGVFTSQDLAGRRMMRAPEWSIQGGLSQEIELGTDQTLELSGDVSYSSGFFAASSNKPGSFQKAYALLDAGMTYRNEDAGFTVALLGRNLTNRYVFFRTIDSVFTGSGTGTNTAVPSDTLASINRGRELWVRFSMKFGE